MKNTTETSGKNQFANFAFICDENYVMPTAVSLYSLIKNKAADSCYTIYIVCSSLSGESEALFKTFEKDDIRITIIRQNVEKVSGLHTFAEGAPCVASVSALLKFYLPDLLQDLEKVLYLDGDLLVLEDIADIYNTELGDDYLAAVVDSGTLYAHNDWIDRVENYFNSGVMLLNLAQMRKDALTHRLVEAKLEYKDSSLMDQNIFNLVCNKRVKMLPIRYNLLHVNLTRAKGNWSIEQINERYSCVYTDEYSLFQDAAIMHFSSKDKPWKNAAVVFAEVWFKYYFDIADRDRMQCGTVLQNLYTQFDRVMQEKKRLNTLLQNAWNRNDELKGKLQIAWDYNKKLETEINRLENRKATLKDVIRSYVK